MSQIPLKTNVIEVNASEFDISTHTPSNPDINRIIISNPSRISNITPIATRFTPFYYETYDSQQEDPENNLYFDPSKGQIIDATEFKTQRECTGCGARGPWQPKYFYRCYICRPTCENASQNQDNPCPNSAIDEEPNHSTLKLCTKHKKDPNSRQYQGKHIHILEASRSKFFLYVNRKDKAIKQIKARKGTPAYKEKKAKCERKYEFKLSYGYGKYLMQLPCHYCGQLPILQVDESNPKIVLTGIDRLYNEDCYHRGNVVPCCGICNDMKGEQNYEEFLSKCITIADRVNRETTTIAEPIESTREPTIYELIKIQQ